MRRKAGGISSTTERAATTSNTTRCRLVKRGSQTIAVRLGQGDGTFGGATSYTGSGAVALGDIDGDGALDVVVSNESAQTVSVLRGVGDGTLQEATTSSSNGGRIAPLADFNGDGVLDVAVGYYNASTSLTALLGQCDGSLGSQGDYDIGSQPRSLVLGDLNGDGAPDLAAPNYGSHTISVLLGVPIPEPTSGLLALTALLTLAGLRRRAV